ncbi:MAG: pectate lyase [Cyclobacteriaceae bacterium]|nr:pectate lyase [Cyclobacteriaceae bacterium]
MRKRIFLIAVGIGLLFTRCGDEPETGDNAPDDKPVPVAETAYAFPGAEGFGKNTTGGRGGRVIFVTNLNDSGEGSLRAALTASGARMVVFKVSGNIELKSRINITNGNLTVAGQTAPGDGICVQNYEVVVSASNIIIRYMRFRLGDLFEQETDAIWGRYQKDIIIDHCSVGWSVDEAASFYANQNFTMQWCILSESLNESFHGKGEHGYGAIWGGDKATFHHNLLAHHNSRNPRFNGGGRSGISNSIYPDEHVDFRSNVVYNWRGNSAYGGENGNYNIVNNYYKPGPATPANRNKRIMQVSKENDTSYGAGYGKFYIAGNYVHGNTMVTADNWNGGVDYAGGVTQALVQLTSPIENDLSTNHTAEQAFESVLKYAGASLSRDAVDTRVTNEVRNGTSTYNGSKTGYAGILDSQADAGCWPVLNSTTPPVDTDGDGMPDVWEIEMKLDPNTANANGRELSTAYDNIEVYINSLVKHITQEQIK